ncbi:MAG: retention module-containing protein [Candidatus Sedimenticola sp. (ex Thyasira tokunagai)]
MTTSTTTNPIGFVEFVKGAVTASTDGVFRTLVLGDPVFANDTILTGDAGIVTLLLNDGTRMDLGRNSEAVLDSEVYDIAAVEDVAAAIASVEAIQEAILAGADPTALLPPTAAGPTAAGAPGEDGGGHDFVTVELTGQRAAPESGFETTGLAFAFDQPEGEVIYLADEPLPVISIADNLGYERNPVREVDSDPDSFITFEVTRSGPIDGTSSVHYEVMPGSVGPNGAQEGNDYNGLLYDALTGDVTFAPGETSVMIKLDITDDFMPEETETFTVVLSNPDNATIDDGEALGTIIDDDMPVVSINNIEGSIVEEGDYVGFEVSLNYAGTQDTTVALSASDGSAVSSDDGGTAYDDTDYDSAQFYIWNGTSYEALSGNQLTLSAGEMSQTVYLQTFNNDPPFNEVMENLSVTVDAVSGATGSDSAFGYITDSDLPTVSIAPNAEGDIVEEGNALAFDVSLDDASDQAATVNLSFTGGSASSSSDYTQVFYADAALTEVITSVTFQPGDTLATVYVGTIDNAPPFNELDETVQVTASAGAGAQGSDNAIGTITDSDLPTVSIAPNAEGDIVEEGNALAFDVSLDDASDQAATVNLSFTGGSASSSSDYTQVFYADAALTEVITSVTFQPGDTLATVYVGTIDNDPPFNELDETVQVTATAGAGAQGSDNAIGTITDSDLPTVSIAPNAEGDIVEEGNALAFDVSLDDASDQAATVNLSFTGGSASSSSDYTQVFYADAALTEVITSVTFQPGDTLATVYVGTIDNDPPFNELDETVQVTATAGAGAQGSDNAIGTITDSDLPTVSIAPNAEGDIVEEGNALAFDVSLDDASDQAATVNLSFTGGSASSSSDYTQVFYADAALTEVITSVTFQPGDTLATVYVGTIDNDPPFNELDETVQVTATAGAGAQGSDNAIGTITDSDLPTVSIAPNAEGDIVEEGNALAFDVSLDDASDQAATVNLSFTGGSASSSSDYTQVFYADAALTEVITSVTFQPGDTLATVYVGTIDNDPPFNELDETVQVTATAGAGAQGSDNAIGTITDSDLPTVSIAPNAEGDIVEEGNALAFDVSLDDASDQAATVNLSFTGGSASSSSDYTQVFYADAALTEVITSVTFQPGDTLATVYVGTIDNDPPFNELDETVQVTATAGAGAQGSDNAIGTITDSDLPTINISGGDSVEEGGWLVYHVYLNDVSDQTVNADIGFGTAGTANADDFVAILYSAMDDTSAPVTEIEFAPGQTETYVYVKTTDNDPPYEEPMETVEVELSGFSGDAIAGTTEALGYITDATLPPHILTGALITNSNNETQILRMTLEDPDNPDHVFTTLITLESEGQQGSIFTEFALDAGFDIDPTVTYVASLQWVSGPKALVTDFELEGVVIIEGTTGLNYLVSQSTDHMIRAHIRPGDGPTGLILLEEITTPDSIDGHNAGGNTLNGTAEDDVIAGRDGDDILNGYAGNDVLFGGEGADTMDGGAGEDTATYFDSDDPVYVNLSSASYTAPDGTVVAPGAHGGDAQGDILTNIENVVGSEDGDDILVADGGNTLIGLAGDDILVGGDGNDVLIGGFDEDTLYGGAGNDILDGNSDPDIMTGGTGDDMFLYRHFDDAGDRITDYNQNEGGENDVIDIAQLLVGFTADPDTIGQFVQLEVQGGDTMLSVLDPKDSSFVDMGLLEGVVTGDMVTLVIDELGTEVTVPV